MVAIKVTIHFRYTFFENLPLQCVQHPVQYVGTVLRAETPEKPFRGTEEQWSHAFLASRHCVVTSVPEERCVGGPAGGGWGWWFEPVGGVVVHADCWSGWWLVAGVLVVSDDTSFANLQETSDDQSGLVNA
jgi:hypothetical protein